VAWSVADLAGVARPATAQLDVALRLRSATPLLLSSLPVPGQQPTPPTTLPGSESA
jgi:hypothetical protein